MSLCHGCRKPLSGDVVQAMGKQWHRSCFVCAGCGFSLADTQFTVFKGQPWHIGCLCCPGCQKPVQNQYIEQEGKPWHVACFHQYFTPKCSVCGKAFQGSYLQDFWGNCYCAEHSHYDRCVSCSRIICGPLTGGGMRFPDGIVICNLCCESGVVTVQRAELIAVEMRQALKTIGLNLVNVATPVHLAGRDELYRFSRHQHHEEHALLGLARWQITMSGKRIVGRSFQNIIIQQHLPEFHFRTVMIHELCHAWFFYNHYEGLPLEVEEGMCVLMEYLWLRTQKTEQSAYFIHRIKAATDPIYGEGFRQARQALKRLSMRLLLQYLKENRCFPSAIAAFFYY
ncbi:MAG: protein DA1 [Endozoicomonadaceae bacterium]|nr:protein DA1 [Endozoicomonadaceae bacterium]